MDDARRLNESAEILRRILAMLDILRTILGDQWPAFRTSLLIVVDFPPAAAADDLTQRVDTLVEIGLASAAADLFRTILRRNRAADRTRGYLERPRPAAEQVDSVDGEETARSAVLNVLQAARDLQSALEPLQVGAPLGRYLNAGFFTAGSDAPLTVETPPSLDAGAYRLGINIGRFWGPGTPDQPLPEAILAPAFAQNPVLLVDIVARSLDARIEPASAQLPLAATGDSPFVFFTVTFARTGRQAIDVDLIWRGHLLQSRRTEVHVVSRAGEPVPASAWPVQDGYVTFCRTATLDAPALAALARRPSRTTILAQRDIDYQRIGLRFYDGTGADLGMQQSTLTDANLGQLLRAVRQQLLNTMQAYTGVVGGTRTRLEANLGQLAWAGRQFYLALLPGLAGQPGAGAGPPLESPLEPGQIVQVAPLSAQVGVPWELLYERKYEAYRPGRTRLCATYVDHGPALEDCPDRADPRVVCPHGFWGYRYVIEQLPARVAPHVPLRTDALPMFVPNALPLRFRAIVFSGFERLTTHLEGLRKLAPESELDLVRVDTLEGARAALGPTQPAADVLYFFSHGGNDAFGAPYLEIGNGDRITLLDLDAWGIEFDRRHPMVILNACDTADYSPDSFENLVQFFCDRGAAGVIATQCEVKELLADVFMLRFLPRFLRQQPAGQALFEARQSLLRDEHPDPRGLAYSLFAVADLQLATLVAA